MKKKKGTSVSFSKKELQKQLKKKSSALKRLEKKLIYNEQQQARKEEIEAALETVRSRSLAMHQSDELKDVIGLVFEKLRDLSVTMSSACILTFEPDDKGYIAWAANPDMFAAASVYTPYFDHPISKAIYALRKKDQGFIDQTWTSRENKTSWEYLFENSDWRNISDDNKQAALHFEGWGLTGPVFKNSATFLVSYSQKKYTAEEKGIIKRFGSVFEQAFIRFLDLQTAEAQTREGQIELSLERVRARAMAMQKSGELSELVDTVFRELTKLDFALTWCIINIIDESSLSNTVWAANPNIDKAPESYHMKFEDYPFHHAMMKGWKERKTKYVYILEGLEKKTYDEYLFNETEFSRVPKEAQAVSRAIEKYVVSFSFSNFGGLQTVGEVPLSDANLDILSRFGKVFDLTYTRFNDLKQAEAQAREAQIELSLERVRAKTMAMHNSQDVADTVVAMFDELVKLGIDKTIRCGIAIIGKKDDMEIWTASSRDNGQIGLDIGRVGLTIHPLMKGFHEAWKKKKTDYTYALEGGDLTDYFNALNASPEYPVQFDLQTQPSKLAHRSFFFPEGALYAFAPEPLTTEASKILKRFAGVFGQTYRRYLDLEKAEAQARQAHIEAAMEKVRARSLTMQKPEELVEVAEVLRKEMGSLGIEELETSSIYIIDENKASSECWYAIRDIRIEDKKLVSDHMIINLQDTWVGREMQKFYSSKEKQISILMEGEKRKEWINYCAALSKVLQGYYGDEIPERTYHLVKFSNGYIGAASPGNISAESWDLLHRATSVFSFAYTRFLDLQKAEAQTREAQIELALERVRARTMAMFKSDELAETSAVLFHQLIGLGIEPNRLFIGVIKDESDDIEAWATDEDGIKVSRQFTLSSKKNISIKKMYDGWKAQKTSVIIDLQGKELENYFQYLVNELHVPFTIGLHQKRRVQHLAYFSRGFIGMAAPDEQPLSTINLLERFASVFNLTYTRFTDLQQAEAQAREAKIETGLERVRSRAMAMHKTDELLGAAELVYRELTALGIESMSINYAFVDEEEKYASYYSINPIDGKIPPFPFVFPHTQTEVMRSILSSWKKKESFNVIELDEEATVKHQTYIGELVQLFIVKNKTDIPFSLEEFLAISPKKAVIYSFNFSNGYLFIIGGARLTKVQEEMVLRFTKVFEMAYRRFLDLKQAESLAREATIEAALERVRGRAIAMHNSNDLSLTASMVFTELRKLGINPIRSGVGLISKETHKVTLYGSTTSGNEDSLTLVGWTLLQDHPVLIDQYKYWLRKEDYFPVLKGELLKSYYRKLSENFGVTAEQSDHEQYGYFLMFSEGFLFCWSQKQYSEQEVKILSRFKAIIDLTFRRYLELQKSEANANEAVKQAALDRVRADIASMRTPDDLEKITPLIWGELMVLGIPFIRCGVFIMDEQLEHIHTFLSTPEGKAIAAFHIPYTTPGNIQQVLHHWRQRESYIDHWDEKAFKDFADTLVKQGALASSEQYLQTIPHGGFHLHFLPFLQGMLYVGNSTRLEIGETKLIQSVADAFSTAYARYEDFKKLEAAKQTVEKTLVNLKLAQQQLVQSEKMASLGELTAGIAHEIQNPLNFVNNFSEVSNELIDEMTEELNNGKFDQAKEIAQDIRLNLEKINHHGKRADAIVKGMLQHSRSSTGTKEPTDINALADEYLRLSYHGLRAKDNSFNAKIKTDFDESVGKINIISQDIGRVLLNLYNNAFYAVNEKKKQIAESYEPTVFVRTNKYGNLVSISVRDNGNGIPQKEVDKIFQPFFTTKPTGQGTGLGLSLSYDIIKAHGGEIKVETKEGEGSNFIIQL